ncbi:lytic transglycosylase domain-containing protein [Treponema socranskii]|uniref:flagellar assembly lytic transglycosylase n=1 Tax=Treponema socranskii TaxID=53419 RepID=UPI003D940355
MLKLLISFVLFAFAVGFSGCNESGFDSLRRLYGEDANYYIALRKKSDGDEKAARQLFLRCAKKGSYYAARRSAEELARFGSVQERLSACEKLSANYTDEDALLIALREYENAGEYSKILVLTEPIDVTSCGSEIARIKLSALFKRSSQRFEDEAYKWYTSRSMTPSMYRLYQETVTEGFQSAKSKIINFRIDVYNANYNSAYERFSDIVDITIKNKALPLTAQIVSDMGKACLYGSSSRIKNAKIFSDIAANEKNDADIVYNAYFYAGRLYDKADSDYAATAERFARAMDSAPSGAQYDNALWYLLNGSLRVSIDTAIDVFKTRRAKIDNPSYFDDFFELFAPLLLSQSRWNDFKKVYDAIDGYASDVSVGRFAYLYGRLVQEGLVASEAPKTEAENAFRRVLSLDCDLYYKVLAAAKLDLGVEEVKAALYRTKINKNFIKDEAVERLLTGYALFGLPEKIYPEWLSFTSGGKTISVECAAVLSDFLNKAASGTDEYYTQSLRIIAKAAAYGDEALGEDVSRLLYPRNYAKEVSSSCEAFGIDEAILYALIRTESFFSNNVISAAGARGLTQLMDLTADEIAMRLKRSDYNLLDPATNIEFGAYYLAYLTKRLGGSPLTAFFAYNAGIGRVRRWINNSHLELGRHTASDLFLETIPYSETRDYGRKLIAASAMYGILYYDTPLQTVVKKITNR